MKKKLFECIVAMPYITIPKIMILGIVMSNENGPHQEPSLLSVTLQYQPYEQKWPHAADGEPYLFFM